MKKITHKLLLDYIRKAVDSLLEAGHFDNGYLFRRTQREALEAYQTFLAQDWPAKKLLEAFFEMPTGTGKTAVFAAILDRMHHIARDAGQKFKSIIVVPTIHLLGQTRDDIYDFAPGMKGRIGFYGNGFKDLSNPSTVMTYPASMTLMEEGHIGSFNTHFKIEDEGHRGTSARKIRNLKEAFGGATLKTAWTATARFDLTKTVEKTHTNQVFSRSVGEVVSQGGELARYVHTQLHVIEVDPFDPKADSDLALKELGFEIDDEDEEFDDWQEKSKNNFIARMNRQLRRLAWNARVKEIFKYGLDEISGDPLSDNKTGFFTTSIWQIDRLAAELNEDRTLRRKAAAMGLEGVAVPVHSKLRGDIKERNFKAYKAGRFMAVVGDDMFKEGFDYKPLKTVIDSHHDSLVDKAQIIGRGAREWANEVKHRHEGLTVIDTITYTKDSDLEENEKIRKRALVGVVTAADVLGGTVLLGPGVEPKEKEDTPREKRPVIIPGQRAESYTKLVAVKNFHAKIDKIRRDLDREDWIEITHQMRLELEKEISRTGKSEEALINNAKDLPQDMTAGKLASWRHENKTAHRDHWKWVMDKYHSLPDAHKIHFTQKMRAELKKEMERTNKKAKAFLDIFKKIPSGLNRSLLNSWITQPLKTVSAKHWKWVIDNYKSLPDAQKNKKIQLTSTLKEALSSEIKRTGKGSKNFFNEEKTKPKDFKSFTIDNWLQPKTKTANAAHWRWAIATYKSLPDNTKAKKIAITNTMKRTLESEMQRTGKKPYSLIKEAGDALPGITRGLIESWRSTSEKRVKNVRKDFWKQVTSYLRSLPDESPKP